VKFYLEPELYEKLSRIARSKLIVINVPECFVFHIEGAVSVPILRLHSQTIS